MNGYGEGLDGATSELAGEIDKIIRSQVFATRSTTRIGSIPAWVQTVTLSAALVDPIPKPHVVTAPG